MRGFGSSGGVVMSELFWPDGETHRTAVVAKQQGQRMAALPAVYVALRLCHDDAVEHAGARTCVDILGADELLELLVVDGYDVFTV
jgi:hypothetical protein